MEEALLLEHEGELVERGLAPDEPQLLGDREDGVKVLPEGVGVVAEGPGAIQKTLLFCLRNWPKLS